MSEPDLVALLFERADQAIPKADGELMREAARALQGVAHHGPPILTERDAKICAAMSEWMQIVRGLSHGPDWYPGAADIAKSRLFWRLRSGKRPLPEPPPTAYSCPWYEVVEEDHPHWTWELWTDAGYAYIAQCPYKIESAASDGTPEEVSFNCYRFRVWKGASPQGVARWTLQRIVEPLS